MQAQPYLYFEGRAEEAMNFYKQTIGAQIEFMMRMKEAPEQPQDDSCQGATAADNGDKILHANIRVGDTQVMVSDGMCTGKPEFKGFSLTLTTQDDAEAAAKFAALGAGGTVLQPLMPTFFATSFGMLHDKFGVMWIVIAPRPMEQG